MDNKNYISVDNNFDLTISPIITEPLFWIKELRFYGNNNKDLRRAIKLRQGLNILWSTSTSDQQDNASGHAAGKTLFCRMLRHIMGEDTFANKTVTSEIRDKFPYGVIVADIRYDNTSYLIVRPIGPYTQDNVYHNGTFEMWEDNSLNNPSQYKEFMANLNKNFMHKFPLKTFPNSQENISWDYIYPLFAKDQECGFNHPLNWREAESESEAKNPSYEKNSYLLRGFISDISSIELDLISQKKILETNLKYLDKNLISLNYHCDEIRNYLKSKGFKEELLYIDDELGYDTAIENLNKDIESKKSAIDNFQANTQNQEELNAFSQAKSDEFKLKTEYKERNAVLTAEKLRLKSKTEKLTKEEKQEISFADKIKPVTGFRCNTPYHIALKEGCPCTELYREKEDKNWEEYKKKQGQDIFLMQCRINLVEKDLEKLKKEIAIKHQITQNAKLDYDNAQNKIYNKLNQLHSELLPLKNMRLTLEQGKLAFDKLQKMKIKQELNTKDLKYVNLDIKECHRRSSKKERLVSAFTDVLKYVIKPSYYGKISFNANSMQIEACTENKEQDSAGYKVINSIALDYALLLLGIEGKITHPLLLIHDSPKNADLEDHIYHKLFEYIKLLEDKFNSSKIPFQYIITTTGQPPEEYQQAPYLMQPILDAAIPEKRLLGINL